MADLLPLDHYRALELEPIPAPSDEEIKRAFRRLARVWHPDQRPDDPQAADRFTLITGAYKVLGDPARRARYDARRAAFLSQMATGTARAAPTPTPAAATAGSPSTTMERLFQRRRREPGAAIAFDVPLTLHELLHGSVRALSYPRQMPCPLCKGDGRETPQHAVSCEGCGGSGLREQTFRTGVRLRAGLRPGDCLTFSQLGHVGVLGAPAGPLHVRISLAAAPGVEVDGSTVSQVAVCSVTQLRDGMQLILALPDGREVPLDIPPGTQPGQQWIMPEAGLFDSDGRRGDYCLQIAVDLDPEAPRTAARLAQIADQARHALRQPRIIGT